MPRSRAEENLPSDDKASHGSAQPAILFDLDGTLLDSNYQHAVAWCSALRRERLNISHAFLHRCIGMRDELLIRAVSKEIGRPIRKAVSRRLENLHKHYFEKTLSCVQVLSGAVELLKLLSRLQVRWAIATGGDKGTVAKMISPLGIPAGVPVVTADHVEHAKPEPDVFLAAAGRLGVSFTDCIVVGDSVWDLLGARRAKALGVGLRSGGYGEAELVQAGAYRTYKDPADLLDHLAEIGIQPR